jgi:hypothetical protein
MYYLRVINFVSFFGSWFACCSVWVVLPLVFLGLYLVRLLLLRCNPNSFGLFWLAMPTTRSQTANRQTATSRASDTQFTASSRNSRSRHHHRVPQDPSAELLQPITNILGINEIPTVTSQLTAPAVSVSDSDQQIVGNSATNRIINLGERGQYAIPGHISRVRGDGDCHFHCFSLANKRITLLDLDLSAHEVPGNLALTLRQQAAQVALARPDFLLDPDITIVDYFSANYPAQTYESFWQQQFQQGVYAEDISIRLLAALLNVSVNVWTECSQFAGACQLQVSFCGFLSDSTINLLLNPGRMENGINLGGHFDFIDDMLSVTYDDLIQQQNNQFPISVNERVDQPTVPDVVDLSSPHREVIRESSSHQQVNKHNKGKKFSDWSATIAGLLNRLVEVKYQPSRLQDQLAVIKEIYGSTPPDNQFYLGMEEMNAPNMDPGHDVEDNLIPEVLPSNLVPDDNIKLSIRHLHAGNISKARRLLSSDGIASLDNPATVAAVKAKYPLAPRTDMVFPEPPTCPRPFDFDDGDTVSDIIRQINKYKKNAAESPFGFCMDNIQDLLHYQPGCVPAFLYFLELIMTGDILPEGMSLVLRARGIPLQDLENKKIRPIVCECPFLKISSQILNRYALPIVKEICGPSQLGNSIAGGAEILGHTVRMHLDANPDWAVIKVDIKNAFNSLFWHHLLEVVARYLPGIFSFLQAVFKSNPTVIFNDKRANVNFAIEMQRGLNQGNPLSGTLFNLAQADILNDIRSRFPDITILSYMDDHYIIGPPDVALSVLPVFDQLFATIGLERAPLKSQIYRPVELEDGVRQSAEIHQVSVVPSGDGVIVVGVPVGTNQFVSAVIQKCVDRIVFVELPKLSQVTLAPTGRVKSGLQVMTLLMRLCVPSQLTFLLRTCRPLLTEAPAEELDKALRSTLYRLLAADGAIGLQPRERQRLTDMRVHLSIKEGGLGITSSKEMRHAAYVGSVALCMQYITRLCPSLRERIVDVDSLPLSVMDAYEQSLVQIDSYAHGKRQSLAIGNIIAKTHRSQQREIGKLLHEYNAQTITAALPHGYAASGYRAFGVLADDLCAQGVLHLANRDAINSAFLLANPSNKLYRMTDAAFIQSMMHRLLIPVRGNREYCLCGEKCGDFLSHSFKCPQITVRNKIRNPVHRLFKERLSEIVGYWNKECSRRLQVSTTEPKITDHFPLLNDRPVSNDIADRRGDILITRLDTGEDIILDVTSVEPTRTVATNTPYIVAGDAAKLRHTEKMNSYTSAYNLDQPNKKFQVVAFETSCVLHPEVPEFLKNLLLDPQHPNYSFHLNQLYQQISMAMHTIRAQAINTTLEQCTLNNPPEQPYFSARSQGSAVSSRRQSRSSQPRATHRRD